MRRLASIIHAISFGDTRTFAIPCDVRLHLHPSSLCRLSGLFTPRSGSKCVSGRHGSDRRIGHECRSLRHHEEQCAQLGSRAARRPHHLHIWARDSGSVRTFLPHHVPCVMLSISCCLLTLLLTPPSASTQKNRRRFLALMFPPDCGIKFLSREQRLHMN